MISISNGGGEHERRVTNFTTKIQDVTFMQILFACTYFYLKLQIVNNIFFFYVFIIIIIIYNAFNVYLYLYIIFM